jgi:hypothetical protein
MRDTGIKTTETIESAASDSGSAASDEVEVVWSESDSRRKMFVVLTILVLVLVSIVVTSIVVPVAVLRSKPSTVPAASQQEYDYSDYEYAPTVAPASESAIAGDILLNITIDKDDGGERDGNEAEEEEYDLSPPTIALNDDLSPPTIAPIARVDAESNVTGVSIFYAIGDVPYNSDQAKELRAQMGSMPSDAEFVIHVGDVRKAGDSISCELEDYTAVAESFRLSQVPVFVIMGDNDWNDCPNPEEGLNHWQSVFLNFESTYWNHTFNIQRLSGRPDNFAFQSKGTLFIGLNLVGGEVLDSDEWEYRLTSQAVWVRELVLDYRQSLGSFVTGRVVIFGHADPSYKHRDFFGPLEDFIDEELENGLPILYLNGDTHKFKYESSFYDQESFLRIMVTGGTSEPPLKITVNANGEPSETDSAFLYDRRL